jgi:hypothetical protein
MPGRSTRRIALPAASSSIVTMPALSRAFRTIALPPAFAWIRVMGDWIAGSTIRALRIGPTFLLSVQW